MNNLYKVFHWCSERMMYVPFDELKSRAWIDCVRRYLSSAGASTSIICFPFKSV